MQRSTALDIPQQRNLHPSAMPNTLRFLSRKEWWTCVCVCVVYATNPRNRESVIRSPTTEPSPTVDVAFEDLLAFAGSRPFLRPSPPHFPPQQLPSPPAGTKRTDLVCALVYPDAISVSQTNRQRGSRRRVVITSISCVSSAFLLISSCTSTDTAPLIGNTVHVVRRSFEGCG